MWRNEGGGGKCMRYKRREGDGAGRGVLPGMLRVCVCVCVFYVCDLSGGVAPVHTHSLASRH